MASQGYYDWLKAGKPYTLIRPATAIVAALRAHGITVYHYPNGDHLKADRPQDHTPFSVTGWPGTNARWNARGVDVMPRSGSAAHRKENADIARQLIRDRNAGHPGVMWIKYLNWTDEQGVCRQERWTPNHTTVSSTDAGHIHISGRSDADTDARADGYDPVARMNGDDDMDLTDQVPGVPGLTVGLLFQDLATNTWAQRGLTLDAQGIPQRHSADRWTAPHLLAAQTRDIRALDVKLDAVISALAAIVAAGGSADAAAILAGIKAEIRDAVADLGEGGAAQVRADE